jgi:hypothetical protein
LGRVFLSELPIRDKRMRGFQNKETLPIIPQKGKLFPNAIFGNTKKFTPALNRGNDPEVHYSGREIRRIILSFWNGRIVFQFYLAPPKN